ncbi:MAG: NUDIX domain-containing protein [Treponema sp.]|nr:NUDIX domain-containing protein [Treponema sp.]
MQIDGLEQLFSHCPRCGKGKPIVENNHRIYCTACGFELFHNVAAAVGALVMTQGGLLLIKRAKEPAIGKYALPGGFVDPEESLETALLRECAEEIGWTPEMQDVHYFCSFPNTYRYNGILYHTCDTFFLIDGKFPAVSRLVTDETEVSDICTVPLNNIVLESLAFESTRKAVQKLIKTAA